MHDLGGGDEERIAGRVRVIGGDVEVAHAEGEETLVPIKHRVREREEPRERDDDGQDEENVLLRARQTAPFSQIWPGDGRHGRQRRLARPSWDVVANGMISAENSRKGVRRRWYLDLHGIRREGTKESGFSYRLPNGSIVSDDKVLARIRKLRIPPAWRDVRIARGDAAPLQAVGVDKKGRTQYLYHSRFRAQREEAKFKRVVEFGESLPALRRRVRADLNRGKHASRRDDALQRERVLASMVRLIDQGFFRIGNDKSAKSESTFGLSTIRGSHVKVDRDVVLFEYVGKWRKKQKRAVRDHDVATIIEQLKKKRGAELFKFQQNGKVCDVKDRHVNEYIQSIIGRDFTAKDFRTWAGTLLCSIALALQEQGASKAERKRRLRKAITATAEQLGNTPAVCRSSYICPRLIDEYTSGRPFEMLRKTRRGNPVSRTGLSIEEKALLKFLRETIADRRRAPRAAA
ncbi:MAG: DNA topoisomerase [Acidobacteria bacterium]|nr:MAG: DNA topoisomerase [Acidobacteriota bacterium]